MKKFIALILAVLLIASMSVTAFAADVADGDITSNTANKKTGDVKVQVTDAAGNVFTADATYFVVITWGDLIFDLEVANPKTNITWDGDKYNIVGGNWDDETTHYVTVTNKSDAKVAISAAFSNGNKTSEKKYEVAATITNGDKTLADAVNKEPDSTTYTISLSAAPKTLPELAFEVDTITVTVQTVAAATN